jgi:hypothetical protein
MQASILKVSICDLKLILAPNIKHKDEEAHSKGICINGFLVHYGRINFKNGFLEEEKEKSF